MTYGDKTWCMAPCKAENCPRKLTPEDKQVILEEEWLVSYADYSNICTKYEPDNKEEI